MQELMNTGGARNLPAGRGGKVSSHVATTSMLNTGTSTAAYSLVAAQRAVKLQRQEQEENTTINAIQTVGTIGIFASFMGDLATAALSKILTIGGLGGEKWAAKVNGVLRSVPRALRDTEIQNIGDLGHNITRKRVEFNMRGGVVDEKLLKGYEKAEAQRAKAAARTAAKATTAAVEQPSKFGQWLMKFKPFQWLDNQFRKFANWRHDNNLKQAATMAGELSGKLDTTPKERGWAMKKMGKKPVSYSSGYSAHVENNLSKSVGKISDAAGHAGDLEAAAKAGITDVRNTTLKFGGTADHSHAFGLRSQMRQIANHAGHANDWKPVANAKGSAIVQALKGLPKGLGRASVFHVLAGVGMGVGIIARTLETKRDNRLGDVGLENFAADVYGIEAHEVTREMVSGPNAHPLVKEAAKINQKTKGGRNAYTAISGAAEMANVGTLKSGGMLLLPWFMFGDKAVQGALVSENDTLKAHNELVADDQGKAKLSQEDRVGRVRYLITAVPGFAAQHSIDNRYIEPVAIELVKQGLSTREIVQTIANPEKLMGMVNQVKGQVDAQVAQAQAPAEAASKAPETMLAAGKPATKVMAEQASHEGTVSTQQKVHAHS